MQMWHAVISGGWAGLGPDAPHIRCELSESRVIQGKCARHRTGNQPNVLNHTQECTPTGLALPRCNVTLARLGRLLWQTPETAPSYFPPNLAPFVSEGYPQLEQLDKHKTSSDQPLTFPRSRGIHPLALASDRGTASPLTRAPCSTPFSDSAACATTGLHPPDVGTTSNEMESWSLPDSVIDVTFESAIQGDRV